MEGAAAAPHGTIVRHDRLFRMRLPLFKLLQSLRASYWFVPTLMALAALVLGAVMVWVDARIGSAWLDGLGWYQKAKPEGAREVLSTIAGSMITVAGVAFSITIVAIAFAAGQYGPRVLTNFMSDRGNQVTLGTFIATFAYSLIVLRTIHGGDSDFVPQLAVAVALVLALCSIGVLIYFIHHVPQSIHVNSVVTRIGRQLVDHIGRQFPTCFGEAAADAPTPPPAAMRDKAVAIRACANGYVQAIDEDSLMTLACDHDLIVWLERVAGDFMQKGQLIAFAAPAARVGEEVAGKIRGSYSLGGQRTPAQDLLFPIDELVEIAARALSPGINDPYTAMSCIDWLGAAAGEMARRGPPSDWRADREGQVRVHAPTFSFEEQVRRGFGRMRPYVATDPNASVHALHVLAASAQSCMSSGQVAVLAREAEQLVELARTELSGPSLDRVESEYGRIRAELAKTQAQSPKG